MATRTARRPKNVRRSGPSKKMVRFKNAAAARSRRVRGEKAQRKGDLLSIASAAALGYAERLGWTDKIPAIGELGAPAVLGLAFYLSPMVVKGQTGDTLQRAGAGLLSVAAYEFAEEFEGLD